MSPFIFNSSLTWLDKFWARLILENSSSCPSLEYTVSINDVILMSILALTALNCISDRNKNTDNASRTVEIFESNEQTVINALSFYRSQNIFCRSKWPIPEIWLHLVPLQKLLCQEKKHFYWMQIIFRSDTKFLRLAQYVKKFLIRHKKFGPTQNILDL